MSFPVVINADYTTQAHRQNTLIQYHPLGQRMEYSDGRKWRFVQAGGATLIVGDIQQGPAIVTGDNSDVVVQTAAAVGDTTVSVTASGTSVANFYAKGWMIVNKGTGLEDGYAYKVKSHPVFASATKVITLEPEDPIRVALDITNGEVGFIANPWKKVVILATTATNMVVGVAQTPIVGSATLALQQFGWVQTGGMAAVNNAASMVIGNKVGALAASAGRGGVSTAILDVIGVVTGIPTSAGEYGGVFLRID